MESAPVIELTADVIPTENHASAFDEEQVTAYVSDTTEQEYLQKILVIRSTTNIPGMENIRSRFSGWKEISAIPP